MSLEQAVLLFSVFAFAGWLLKVAYRSWLQKRFVNAGFLHGPFLPIYGLGALFVLGCDALLRDCPLAFPNLRGYLEACFRQGIRERIDETVSELHQRFFAFVAQRHPRAE